MPRCRIRFNFIGSPAQARVVANVVCATHRMIEPRPKAVLVAVELPESTREESASSLAELARLVTTLGYDVVGQVTQSRAHLSPAAVIGEGKLAELAELTGGSGESGSLVPRNKDKARVRRERDEGVEHDAEATDDQEPSEFLVAVDHEISPSQARNLERATGATVLDRTGVIIEIFHRHAKSREARLQVEIARLGYTAPRMREAPGTKERQHGKGSGEAALELDRRKIRDRIKELREELERISGDQDTRRANRKGARRVALVGYTNAGKSSLMRALTDSEVYVEDKLFATLDTTVRALQPEVKPRILVSDTVGFIKKLPHDLVASFKSTLDEALEATLLLHVVDASDPHWEAQFDVTRDVLTEIGADKVESRLVLNKIDRVETEVAHALGKRFPEAWLTSAHDPEAVTELHHKIVSAFEEAYEVLSVHVPYGGEKVVAEMHESGKVEDIRYEEDGIHLRFSADAAVVAKLRTKLGIASPHRSE